MDTKTIENEILGKTLEEAKEIMDSYEVPWRVTREGKDHKICTMDFRPNRANLGLDPGPDGSYIVTETNWG